MRPVPQVPSEKDWKLPQGYGWEETGTADAAMKRTRDMALNTYVRTRWGGERPGRERGGGVSKRNKTLGALDWPAWGWVYGAGAHDARGGSTRAPSQMDAPACEGTEESLRWPSKIPSLSIAI